MMPGMPERRTHDYLRHGITSLFAAFNIADGTVISELHHRRCLTPWLAGFAGSGGLANVLVVRLDSWSAGASGRAVSTGDGSFAGETGCPADGIAKTVNNARRAA